MGFTKLNLDEKLLKGLKEIGFSKPTSIQEKCIPEIKKGHDIVGQSLTGSGKTAAFGIPLLESVVPGNGIQALILTPTRELCVQVKDNLELIGKYVPLNIISIFGGVGYYPQKEDIRIAEIIVATPGRLIDHLNQRNLKLDKVKFVVLDEADRMVDMGFVKDVEKILASTSKDRQTTMFSATMPRAAKEIIKKYLKNPIFITEELHVDKSLLKQVVYKVKQEQKFSLLVHLLKKSHGSAIIFCGTKRMVDKIAKNIKRQGFEALPVHGDIVQSKRQWAVKLFKDKKIDILVATDVAARGIDINNVSHVYNYDIPKSPEDYTHRIGRTARAGKAGIAVNLLSERDRHNFELLIRSGKEINREELPEFEMIEFKSSPENSRFSYDSKSREGRGYGGRSSGRRGYGEGSSRGRSSDRRGSPSRRFGKMDSESENSSEHNFRRNNFVRRRSFNDESSENSFGERSRGPKRDYSNKDSDSKRSETGEKHSFGKSKKSFSEYKKSSNASKPSSKPYGNRSGPKSFGKSRRHRN